MKVAERENCSVEEGYLGSYGAKNCLDDTGEEQRT